MGIVHWTGGLREGRLVIVRIWTRHHFLPQLAKGLQTVEVINYAQARILVQPRSQFQLSNSLVLKKPESLICAPFQSSGGFSDATLVADLFPAAVDEAEKLKV